MKKSFSIFTVILITLCIFTLTFSGCKKIQEAINHNNKEWTVNSLPMVHLQDSTKYLVNPDNIVDKEFEDSTNYYLNLLEHKKGVQTVFVFVNHIDQADDLATFCANLGNKYGVGDKKTDKGLIIAISYKDHKWFIAPGKGLEGELTDVQCSDIGKHFIVDNLKTTESQKPNPNKAALETAKAVYYQIALGKEYTTPIDYTKIIIIIIVIILIIIMVFACEANGIPIISSVGDCISDGGGGSFGGGSFGGGGAGGSW